MVALLTEPVASTLIVLDETDGSTLSEISRATGRSLSTIQRAVDSLIRANVVTRDAPRGRLRLSDGAPRRALRELAESRLEEGLVADISSAARAGATQSGYRAPSTVRDPIVRRAWPQAMDAIVTTYQPERVILFGSQARGDAGPDSDVDLLVVFDGDVDRRETQVGILKLLRAMPFAKDVLVATPASLARPLAGSALADAVRDGVTVYSCSTGSIHPAPTTSTTFATDCHRAGE